MVSNDDAECYRDEIATTADEKHVGPTYTDYEVFDLAQMQPYSLDHLYTAFTKLTNHVVLYLPRTTDLKQLAKYAKEDYPLEVTHYCMNGASKALCVYFGEFGLD